MPSTYTNNLGVQKPADGEQDGVWGDVVNDNMDIIDRAINGSVTLTLTGTSSTLTTTDGTLSNGQYKALILGGTPSATHTITVAPNDAQKIYYVYNLCGQSVIFTQGSGTTVTIATSDTAVIYCNGGGTSAGVVNLTDHFAMNSVKITGGAVSGVSLSSSAATVTGGSVNGTPVGNTTASTGAFTTLAASSTTTLSGTTILSGQVGLGGTSYGTSGQVLTSQGAGTAPAWANSFPSGGIILWSGAIGAIPAGWLLCDGTSGTPDLRDRFVVGAGSTYTVGATGGSATVTLDATQIPAHTHSFSGTTSSDGAHTHTTSFTYFANYTPDAFTSGLSTYVRGFGTAENLTTSSAGAHTHTLSGTTGSIGGGLAHENRPPYYALAYIMKA